ncbi:hypothetical protein ACQCX2_13895 [Propionibacteriaceae bacterium Y1700]|uniref:hypothetical protein n=1 Tax=Microlunatus sp. Y1700 TaxID=3418487 RepID=UPI003DA72B24
MTVKASPALATAWAQFQDLPFPDHADGDQLEDWLFDLLESDGFYAGLATTALAGGQPTFPVPDDDITDLINGLNGVVVEGDHDRRLREYCMRYVIALAEVKAALILRSDRDEQTGVARNGCQ